MFCNIRKEKKRKEKKRKEKTQMKRKEKKKGVLLPINVND
jgi:hypothetical protein